MSLPPPFHSALIAILTMLLPQIIAVTLALAPSLASAAIFPKDSQVKMIDAKGFKKAMKQNVCTPITHAQTNKADWNWDRKQASLHLWLHGAVTVNGWCQSTPKPLKALLLWSLCTLSIVTKRVTKGFVQNRYAHTEILQRSPHHLLTNHGHRASKDSLQ